MTASAGHRPDADRAAGVLSIELTTRCNSACRHCFARDGSDREASLTPAVAHGICAEGFEAGFRHLHLTGGEPLLWSGLFDLLDQACGLGYHSVFMNTNGLLLSEAVAARLAQYPGLGLSVSLQGPEPMHDALRGAGSCRGALQGLSRGLAAGLAVTIFTTVGQTLLAGLPAFALDVHRRFPGIERLMLIQLVRAANAAWDLDHELLQPDHFLRLVRTVSALNLYGIATHVLNDPLVNAAAAMLDVPRVPPSRPLVRPGKLVVRADRALTLAHSTREIIGQYRPGMIASILAGDRYRHAVARDDTTCPACPYLAHCRRHGMRHPSPVVMAGQPEIPYCQSVLAGINPPV
jgi:MoaA/NifB/PqqE/SkfB family radical SAM enzyme